MLTNRFIGAVFFMILACIINNTCYCQKEREMLLLETKLWNYEGDTVEGLIDYINQYNLQFNLTITDTVADIIKYYSPKDIEGFRFKVHKGNAEFHSVDSPFNLGRVFLKLIHKGEYSIYQYLELDQRTSILTFIVHYYLWKDGWLEPGITGPYEKEALLKHFSDCPELDYKIKTGEYGLSKIVEIVKEYEQCDLTDDYEFFYE